MTLRSTAWVYEDVREIQIPRPLSRLTNQKLLVGPVICVLICPLDASDAHTLKRTMGLDPALCQAQSFDFDGGCLTSCLFWQFCSSSTCGFASISDEAFFAWHRTKFTRH